jgi:GNAT superfamily N-acetyltransferase
MERCRATDLKAGPADARMAAYLDGKHHPQQALPPRTAFLAVTGHGVVGYIAGHATTRYGCSGELQYLYVVPSYRRRGVARDLLRCLARWFDTQGIQRVCVNADIENAEAVPFYCAQGAIPLNSYWYVWDNITVGLDDGDFRE